jgi:hypothetical protein
MTTAPDPKWVSNITSGNSPDSETVPDIETDEFEEWVNQIEANFTGNDFTPAREVAKQVADIITTPETDETQDDEVDEEEQIPSPTPVESITLDGEEVPVEELKRLYSLEKQIKAQASQPPPPKAPEFTPPTPPDSVDLDDPGQKAMWDHIVEIERRVFSQQQEFAQSRQDAINQRAASEFQQALSQFKTSYPQMSDDEINTLIRPAAAPLIPGLLQSSKTPIDAMVQSMYLASLANPQLRDKILAIKPDPKHTSQRRKRQQSALTPSSGSTAPRTDPARRVSSDRDAINEFAKQLEDQFSSNGSLN